MTSLTGQRTLGGDGGGVSQTIFDPKRPEDSQNLSQEPNQNPPTPSILNCSNVRFTYCPSQEIEEDDVEDEDDPQVSAAPSPKPEIPKGTVERKKFSYERQSSNLKAKDVKEASKCSRQNQRNKSNIPTPPNKTKKEDENIKPKKDDENYTKDSNSKEKKDEDIRKPEMENKAYATKNQPDEKDKKLNESNT